MRLSELAKSRLIETREFISYLQLNNLKVYGITTGFADLRNISVNPERSAELSRNLILSHDAAIGDPLPDDITLGAMLIRANTLAKGHSGFSVEGSNFGPFMGQHNIGQNIYSIKLNS